jgi:hypothetical protein
MSPDRRRALRALNRTTGNAPAVCRLVMGDVVSAALVFGGTHFGLTASGFARVNVLLAAGFLALAVLVGRAYTGRTATAATPVPVRAREATS